MLLSPPICPPGEQDAALAELGFSVLAADGVAELLDAPVAALQRWLPFWDDLPPDAYLKDGGRYRRRRHGCFIVNGESVTPQPHRPHWQPVEYNALHGGLERHFEPLPEALVSDPLWARWLVLGAQRASALKGAQPWYVEAHLFRIDTTDGIGRPTPEGAHRDGVDLVEVTLVSRHQIKGGETRVFAADGREGLRFTLSEPFSTLWLDDARVIHESTPIQPLLPGGSGHRDTLVLTYRAGGFQGPVG
ncbi:2OG-Fe dioxygenase family protein [Ideonella sp. DXS29W]|uniref:2OG-Fe dioxygenase family protein n=1 Tax=Ideonella lacteola TaxID=2984193 RepID=A0ABU9BLQ9_9BURK